MENFVEIKGFPDYFINREGIVLSKKQKKERIIKFCLSNRGYLHSCLFHKNKLRKTVSLHRLLALTFLPNPNNFQCVDHLDRDKQNNKLENLRWCTHMTNSHNTSISKNNKQGHKNIYFIKKEKNNKTYENFIFQIIRNKKRHTKTFKTLEKAIEYKREYLTNLGEEII